MSNLHNLPEEWRNIPTYEGIYLISNWGRVKSFRRGKEKILKPIHNGVGYYYVVFGKERHLVHRLVARVFLGEPGNKCHVNHIDSDPSNNCLWNLEWVTILENHDHSMSRGNGINKVGSNNKRAVIDELKALAIVHLFEKFDARQIARILNINIQHVYKVTGGKSWSHVTGLTKKYYYKTKTK